MKLQELLYKVNILKIVGNTNIDIHDIQFDSRKIKHKGLFIAIKGTVSDGHEYIESVINDGALAIVVEKIPLELNKKITYIKVVNSYNALGVLAANFYKNPSEKLKLIGVTGTNGKTTTVNLLYQLFTVLKKKTGMLSTIENKILNEVIPSTLHTTDQLKINLL